MFKEKCVLLFFMVFFVRTTTQAQFVTNLISPRFWKSVSQCVICNPKQSLYIQEKKAACERDLAIYQCQDFITQYPELKPNLMNCTEDSICNEMLFQTNLETLGCVKGFGENVQDFVSIFQDLVRSKEQKDLRQMCLNHSECAKELQAFESEYQENMFKLRYQKMTGLNDFRKQMYDPKFNKYTGVSAAIIPRKIYKKYFPKEFESLKLPTQEEFKKFLKDFYYKQTQSLECLNTEARAQLMCYWFFTFVDPIVAAKAIKLDKALSKLVDIFIKDRRLQSAAKAAESEETLKYFKPKEVKVTRSPQRQSFVDKYLHAETSTYQERVDFIELTKLPKSKNRVFVDFENSQLKYLNDTIKDKDFVTSADNFYIKTMNDKLQKLAKDSRPPLKVYRLTDGKGGGLALEGKITPDIIKEIQRLSGETNRDVTKYLLDNKLIRQEDEPHKWFKAGIGDTLDEANQASRISRGLYGENQAYHYSDAVIQENLKPHLGQAKLFGEELASEPSISRFMQTVETSQGPKKVPNLEFFENLRKYPNPQDFSRVMKAKYDVDISESLANKALDYAKIVDDLNPKILVADQSVVTFSDTAVGGMTMDRKGMGAMNQEATAIALTQSSNLDEFLKFNRVQEGVVTQKIEKEREQIKKVLGASSRGDDTVLDGSFTEKQKREILKSDVAANRRTAWTPENTPDLATKQQLNTHGEGLEKVLTDDILISENILSRIPFEKQKNIRFGIDMKTTTLGEGKVDLLVQPVNGVTLTPSERKIIQDSFNEAVRVFNEKQKKLGHSTNYYYRSP